MAKEVLPVSEDLLDTTQAITYNGEVYIRCYKDKLDAFACKYPMSVPKPSKRYAKYSDVDLTIAVKAGAKWQKEHSWKPSEEQMKAIEFMVRSFGDSGTLSPYGETMAYATSLLNDLKKLMEE